MESQRTWQAAIDGPQPAEVERLLSSVPQWFGQPESNAEYISDAAAAETWTVRDAHDEVIGLCLIKRHFPWTAEIHLMVVDRSQQGRGVGTSLIQAIEDDAVHRGVKLLEVKTLGPTHPDPGYAQTRHFYERCGFLAVEETDLWGQGTPCLIMVKPLPRSHTVQ